MSTHLFVARFISEFESLKMITRTVTPRRHAHAITSFNTWKPPPSGHAKIYVDGGMSHDGDVGAAAVVCRDEYGKYLGSSVVVLPGVKDLLVLKAIACLWALALADDLSLNRLMSGV